MTSKSFQKVVKVVEKLENTVQPVVEVCFHSSVIKDVDHAALWLVLLSEVRLPGAHNQENLLICLFCSYIDIFIMLFDRRSFILFRVFIILFLSSSSLSPFTVTSIIYPCHF